MSSEADQDISIVLISRNRAPFLERAFSHLSRLGFGGTILLADASREEGKADVAAVVEEFSGRLKLSLTSYPEDAPLFFRLRRQFEIVTSKYAVWMGDDDLLFPDALREAVARLDMCPGAVGAVGRSVQFEVEGSRSFGIVAGMGTYPQRGYEAATGAQRVYDNVADLVALSYSLRRTSFMQSLLRQIDELNVRDDIFGYFVSELMDGMLTVASGKVLYVDRLMMMRQAHAGSMAATGGLFSGWDAFVSGSDWPRIQTDCNTSLTHALMASDAATKDACAIVAKGAIATCVERTERRAADVNGRRGQKAAATTPSMALRKLIPAMARRRLSRWRTSAGLDKADQQQFRRTIHFIERSGQ